MRAPNSITDAAADEGGTETSSTAAAEPEDTSTTSPDDAADGCFVHLFDSDDLDESEDNYVLETAGRFENLKDLPGADKDWTDEADSIKVGPDATVEIWSEPGFKGTSETLDSGSEHRDIDEEPSSLELTCS